MKFKEILQKCEVEVKAMGIEIDYTKNLPAFFKGDLDGKTIYISKRLSKEEKLFNILHLTGHTIQWNSNPKMFKLGNKLHKKPSVKLLAKLQKYEWDANRIGLSILHKAGILHLDDWLLNLVKIDMTLLTYYYKTGKKSLISQLNLYPYKNKKFKPKSIPEFTAKKLSNRNKQGIVINF